jgi:pimeloyl-ACP methyl ester carboxylesterase
MLSRIADRLILQPTRDPIDPEGKEREWIETSNGRVEAWKIQSNGDRSGVDLLAIKFPGTGGRAERAGPHPFEIWADCNAEVWTINPTGYGGSEGVASMKHVATTCDAVWRHIRSANPRQPIVLIGNSLGCVSALYLAARVRATGLFLRNPVPIHQMISERPRYNWWNFGMARLVARQVPSELDAIANAAQSKCPAFFLRSEADRVVPATYQRRIFESYQGEWTEFVLRAADHHHSVPEAQAQDYIDQVGRLKERWLVTSTNQS